MELKNTDLVVLFEQAFTTTSAPALQEVGFVIQAGDSSCRVHGLLHAVYGEILAFEGGNRGIVLDLQEDVITVFLLNAAIAVREGETVQRTQAVARIGVGKALLGRVVNALGLAIDGLGALQPEAYLPIEGTIPGIIDRTPINQSLETGILAVDALVPIGRGQRELIIGNRSTGKSSLALDTIMHQKGNGVICIYAAVGQRQSSIARMVAQLQDNGCMDYTVVVVADAAEPAVNRYLAPYSASAIAEYFRDQGQDVLVVYDDLSNHAIAYREMSLLMRRSPGREAYPGDVFYLHSRLLERAGKLAQGGSITALPIVQIQADDLAAYIPTNLISITDGQIFLDTKLFNNGIRPAVNVELSVSRVGGAAQTKAIKKVTRALRLELAQYHELLGFSQFGTELDAVSQKRLARGARIIELLKQGQHQTAGFVDHTLMLFLLQKDMLDSVALDQVNSFGRHFVSYVQNVYSAVYKEIEQTQDLSDAVASELLKIAKEFEQLVQL
jgi:F-type H+-transporting ATPase subunit alpha